MPASSSFPSARADASAYSLDDPYDFAVKRGPKATPGRADLLRLGLPRGTVDLTWEHYEDRVRTSEGESLRERLLDVEFELPQRLAESSYNGLVLLGSAGAGKSLGAALLLKSALGLVVPDRGGEDDASRRVTGCFVSASSYVEEKRAIISASKALDAGSRWGDGGRGDLRAWESNMDAVTDFDVLVLDDLGKERSPQRSGFAETVMESEVLRRRGAAGRLTILTSNLTLEQFGRYSVSMASYLHEVGDIVAIGESVDYRKRRRPRR